MPKRYALLLLTVAVLFGTVAAIAGETNHVPDQVILQLTADADHAAAIRMNGEIATTGIAEIDALHARLGVRAMSPLFRIPAARNALADHFGLSRTYRLTLPEGSDVPAVAAAYAALDAVVYAEPNFIAKASRVPDDPLYPDQWGLDNTGQADPWPGGGTPVGVAGADINAAAAWDLHTGDGSIIIAILDTGVDTGHPEFAGRIVPGFDFHNNDSDPMDDNGHGTSCAGIAAAAGDNGIGVAGVNWNARIMPVKVLSASGSGSYAAIANGVTWAADNGARVLSLSLGGGSASITLENAVNYAYGLDCVILASRGNGDSTSPNYPASFANVVAIGALSPCDGRKTPSTCDGEYWWGSSYGNDLDVMAPGTRIHTTDIRGTGGYEPGEYMPTFNGTSAACPFAAGAAALLRSYDPGLSAAEIRQRLRDTAVDVGAPGFDIETGYGRIDVFAALQASAVNDPPVITSVPGTQAVVGQPYAYDADNTVEATGSAPIAFAVVSGPSGFSVSPAGVVDWTPSAGQEGPHAVVIEASNAHGTDTQVFTIDVSAPAPVAFRINAGGGAYTAGAGDRFSADQSYSGNGFGYVGGNSISFGNPIAGTGDDPLFQTYRYSVGSFSYRFDVPDGDYDLILHFAEPFGNNSTFDVLVEGVVRLDNFSPQAASGGINTAHQEAITATVNDGVLDITFVFVGGQAANVCAIEVVEGEPSVPVPDIAVSPGSVDFGAVTVGSSAEHTVAVSNTGSATLTVDGLTTGAPFEVVTPATPFDIPAGGTDVAVTVRFSPTAVGTASGELSIASNDPDENPLLVALAGSGQSQPTPDIAVTPGSVDFGSVTVGGDAERTVTIANAGTATLTVDGLTTGAPFEVVAPSTPFDIPAGGEDVAVTVRFSPTAGGSVSGELSISSNDPDEPSATVALSGSGVVPTLYSAWINAGGTEYTTGGGDTFVADRAFTPGGFGYNGGSPITFANPVAGTSDDPLYQSFRYAQGSFSYAFDGLPSGDFTITLFFMEPLAPPSAMDIRIEGVLRFDDLNVQAAAGAANTAHSETVTATVSDGRLDIDFQRVSGNAAYVSAIRVEQIGGAGMTAGETALPTALPSTMVLEQNYPNPFNPSTRIRFALPEGMHVKLAVYDVMGREVRTLVNGYRDAGPVSVDWDGRDHAGRPVASGIYLYRLQGGGIVEVRKMYLLK